MKFHHFRFYLKQLFSIDKKSATTSNLTDDITDLNLLNRDTENKESILINNSDDNLDTNCRERLNYCYFDLISNDKEEFFRDKYKKYNDIISEVKKLFKEKKVDVSYCYHNQIFLYKLFGSFLSRKEPMSKDNDINLCYNCMEKSIHSLKDNYNFDTIISYIIFFFAGKIDSILKIEGRYIFKSVTLFLYLIYTSKFEDDILLLEIISKITNIKDYEVDTKYYFDKFGDEFAENFKSELIEVYELFLFHNSIFKHKKSKKLLNCLKK